MGISAQEMYSSAQDKHLKAYDEMWGALNVHDRPLEDYIGLSLDSLTAAWFAPPELRGSLVGRIMAGADVWRTRMARRSAA